MPKRRNVLIGTGTLVFASGLALGAGAFNSSVTADGDMRVIVSAEATVRRGSNVPGSDTVNSVNGVDFLNLDESSDSRVDSGNLNFGDLTSDDVPVAAANNGEDGALVIELAAEIGSDVRVEDLIEIENVGDADLSGIGIRYDTYGSDVTSENPSGDDIQEGHVQDLLQFEAQNDGQISSDTIISPNGGPNNGGAAGGDVDPANTIDIGFGVSPVQIDVLANYSSHQGNIRANAAPSGSNVWDGVFDDVDLLDVIQVGEGFTA